MTHAGLQPQPLQMNVAQCWQYADGAPTVASLVVASRFVVSNHGNIPYTSPNRSVTLRQPAMPNVTWSLAGRPLPQLPNPAYVNRAARAVRLSATVNNSGVAVQCASGCTGQDANISVDVSAGQPLTAVLHEVNKLQLDFYVPYTLHFAPLDVELVSVATSWPGAAGSTAPTANMVNLTVNTSALQLTLTPAALQCVTELWMGSALLARATGVLQTPLVLNASHTALQVALFAPDDPDHPANYTLNVARVELQLSNMSIAANRLQPAFAPTVAGYACNVLGDTATLMAQAEPGIAIDVQLPGQAPLSFGNKVHTSISLTNASATNVTVTAKLADYHLATPYTVTLVRETLVLRSLNVSGAQLLHAFDPTRNLYQALLPHDWHSVNITAALAAPLPSVQLNCSGHLGPSSSCTLSLAPTAQHASPANATIRVQDSNGRHNDYTISFLYVGH